MKKILISAYACEPFKGSEQAVGWNIALGLAKTNEVHVITRSNNKEFIEPNIPKEIREHLHFHYYDSEIFKKFKQKEKGIYLYYIAWQFGIMGLAKRVIKQYGIEYAIHLTMGSIWMPTFIAFLPVKFIWGPIGGGEAIPASFIKTLSIRGQLLQYLRYILKYSIYVNPLILFSAIKAETIFYRTEMTRDLLPKPLQKKCLFLADGAIEQSIIKSHIRKEREDNAVKFVATSRFIHTKNIVTIIEAMRLVPSELNIMLTLVGSGPEEKRIKKMISEYQLENKIEHISSVPREQVFKILENSDVYLFASLKEACNLSLLEAMAIGLPVVCLNWTGMALSTDESCAIRLKPSNPTQMPRDMADAIIKLAKNREMRYSMGKAARDRISKVFNWQTKIDTIDRALYKEG